MVFCGGKVQVIRSCIMTVRPWRISIDLLIFCSVIGARRLGGWEPLQQPMLFWGRGARFTEECKQPDVRILLGNFRFINCWLCNLGTLSRGTERVGSRRFTRCDQSSARLGIYGTSNGQLPSPNGVLWTHGEGGKPCMSLKPVIVRKYRLGI